MLNGNGNGGDGSRQIAPMVVQPDRVEESGTLVPQRALNIVPAMLLYAIRLFDGSHIFVHAPHITGTLKMQGMHGDREQITLIAGMLNGFGY